MTFRHFLVLPQLLPACGRYGHLSWLASFTYHLRVPTVLLSACASQVASEDTVLYTAQSYANRISDLQQQDAAKEQLAPLIRCPHLSSYWLTACAWSDDADELLLSGYVEQLQKLAMMRAADAAFKPPDAAFLQEYLPGALASWSAGKRSHKQVSSVSVEWDLDVSDIRTAAQRCAQEQKLTVKCSGVTPPLGGLVWGIRLDCDWDEHAGGTKVGLFAMQKNAPTATYCRFRYTLFVAGADACRSRGYSILLQHDEGYGSPDIFVGKPMAGGWDEAAWAAAGLPASGHVKVKLVVSDVCHNR